MKNSRRRSIENSGRTNIFVNKGSGLHNRKKEDYGLRHRLTQFFCALLIVSILTASAPAAPRTIVVSANEFSQDIRFGYLSSNFAATVGGWTNAFLLFLATPKRKSPQIAKIEILPRNVTVSQGEIVDFSAVAYTNEGDTIGGLKFEWKAEFLDRTIRMQPMRSGRFKSKIPGNYIVIAKAENGQQAQAKVTVTENEALMLMKKLKEEEARGDLTNIDRLKQEGKYTDEEISSKNDYKSKDKDKEAGFLENVFGWLTGEEKVHGPNADNSEYENTSAITSTTALVRPADEDGWDNNNWWTADDPGNQIGDPPGTSPDSGAGNGNFQFSAPIVALPGRGIDLNLSLHYNSRLWSKSGSQMIYDSDKGFPAPGWTLGFGKLMFMGTSGGCMMADADGTRRSYTGTVSNYNYGGTSSTNFTGYTTDSTMIDYSCYYSSSASSKSLSGTAKLPNGSVITYNSPTVTADQAYPTRITDAQGNYITITYRNNQGPEIQTVTDTLGRVINFNYDSLNRLISVDAPQYNGGTRTAVRLHYKQMTLGPGFAAGITTDTATNTPYVLDAIYYPGTNTGYWFNDADSYSSYGMISKVVEQRGMSWSGSAGDQGAVAQGTMTKQAVYNYPLAANYALTDAPTYTTLTETWAGMDTAAAVTNYSVVSDSTTQTITVTYPNGTKSRQISNNNPGQWNDGLHYQNEILDASNNLLGKTLIYMQGGNYADFRPTRVDTTDERGQMTYTTLTYGTNYNQVTSQKEYNYAGTLYRETRAVYENGANYTSRHIFNLVKTSEIYDAGNNRLSRIDYEYDTVALADTPNVVMYDRDYDPNTPEWCAECGACLDYLNYECVLYEGEWVSNTDAIYKGNVTKITTYADAASLTGAIAYDYTYDITGNQRTATTNCCQQMSFNYTSATQYSQPESQTKGSSDVNSPLRMTQSATYDFNTGAMKTATDFNNRTTSTTYDTLTRPTLVTLPTGGKKTIEYTDATLSVTETLQLADNTIAGKTTVTYNGRGQAQTSKYQAGASVWNAVQMKYDAMGRVWKQSLPYDAASSPTQWTEYSYDNLSRNTQTTAPDGSTSKTFYNETSRPDSASAAAGQTVRSQDAWGRERWARTDDFGRLAEVVEPNPNGNGSVFSAGSLKTSYIYDALDNLTQTEQGSQFRYFKYDSLGRLTRQKLAEQTATLNDAGTYVGAGQAGAQWGEAFVYDARSNVTQKTDARGIKTNYLYADPNTYATDPLNRLRVVWYDASGPRDTSITVNPAWNTVYEYMTTGNQERIRKIESTGLVKEEYFYDTEGRVSDMTQTIWYRESYPMTTSYLYDTLNRLTDARYPAQYGIAGSPRKLVHHNYDVASRLTNLTVDNQQQAGDITYNTFNQATSIKVGAAGTNQVNEQYTFDSQTGLMTNQKVVRNGTNLLDLSYEYNRNNSVGTLNGKTGNLTKITNNLNTNKNREYQYDALGRLTTAKGGVNGALWTQNYAYDRYGNKTSVTATGVAADNSAIPRDGFAALSYNTTNNRITTAGFEYDVAGNQTKAIAADGTVLRMEYDYANRLSVVKRDSDGAFLQAYQYSPSNGRLMNQDYISGEFIVYANIGGTTLSEYREYTQNIPTWIKSYVYMGSRLLSTTTPNGQGGEYTEYNHPDRLGIYCTPLREND